MNIERKGACALLSLLVGLAMTGLAACSGSGSDSAPDLFTPAAGSASVTPSLKLDTVPEQPTPAKGATLYLVDVKLAQDGPGKVSESVQFEIVDCTVSVSYGSTDLASSVPLLNADGSSACRAGATPVDLGSFLVGTSSKKGSLIFSIKMHNTDRELTAQGSTADIPVQPGALLPENLVAGATP